MTGPVPAESDRPSQTRHSLTSSILRVFLVIMSLHHSQRLGGNKSWMRVENNHTLHELGAGVIAYSRGNSEHTQHHPGQDTGIRPVSKFEVSDGIFWCILELRIYQEFATDMLASLASLADHHLRFPRKVWVNVVFSIFDRPLPVKIAEQNNWVDGFLDCHQPMCQCFQAQMSQPGTKAKPTFPCPVLASMC